MVGRIECQEIGRRPCLVAMDAPMEMRLEFNMIASVLRGIVYWTVDLSHIEGSWKLERTVSPSFQISQICSPLRGLALIVNSK